MMIPERRFATPMIVKYRPLDEISRDLPRTFQAFEEAVNTFFGDASSGRPWTPPVDVWETENELVLKADVPEVKPENIDVNFENGTLTLRGKRDFEKKDEGKGYHRIERAYGSFVRAFTLPETVDPEKLNADYKNGVLTITIGKKEIAKPKSVKVNVHAN